MIIWDIRLYNKHTVSLSELLKSEINDYCSFRGMKVKPYTALLICNILDGIKSDIEDKQNRLVERELTEALL